MEVNNYLNAVLETAETLSAAYRKSGDSEQHVRAYQNWDGIADRIRGMIGNKHMIKEFEETLRYILFKEENETSTELIKVRLLREHDDQPEIPKEVVRQVMAGSYENARLFIKGMDVQGRDDDMTKEEFDELYKNMSIIAEYLKNIEGSTMNAIRGMRFLEVKSGKRDLFTETPIE